MPAKQPKKPSAPVTAPQHTSYAKVPKSLGEGRVSVYDLKKQGMPVVVDPPPEGLLKSMKWAAVHFPSRRWVLLKNEKDWRALLKEIREGKNSHNLLPQKRTQKRVSKVAHAPASPSPVDGQGEKENQPPEDEGFTPVPGDMKFDAAMDHVFPVGRLTKEWERLLKAEEEGMDKAGNTFKRPAYQVQFQCLKALTEWRVGRPGEKEKPPEEKKRLSHDELIAWLEGNEDAVEYMEEVLKRAKIKQAQAKTQPTAAPLKL